MEAAGQGDNSWVTEYAINFVKEIEKIGDCNEDEDVMIALQVLRT